MSELLLQRFAYWYRCSWGLTLIAVRTGHCATVCKQGLLLAVAASSHEINKLPLLPPRRSCFTLCVEHVIVLPWFLTSSICTLPKL